MKFSSEEYSIEVMFKQGLEAHNTGNFDAAKKIYRDVLGIQPDHSEANHNIGVLLVAKKEFEEALGFFKFALSSSPNVSLFWASYIDALVNLGRIIEAKKLIKAAQKARLSCEKLEAISYRLDTENQDPTKKECQELDKFMAQENFDKAIEVCLNLTESYPRSVVLNITLGKCYFGLQQTELAIACYARATEYQPQSVVGFVMLGQLYSSQGITDLAIKNLKRAVYLKPKDGELNSLLAAQLIDEGHIDEAINYLEKALVHDLNSSLIISTLASAFNEKGDHELAVKYYREALKIAPQDATFHFNMGSALRGTGNLEDSIKSFKKGLKIQPNNAVAINNMANTLKDKGDIKAAIVSYKRALEIQPDLAEAYNNMGNAHKLKGDLEAAIVSYKQALKIQPDYAHTHNSLGCVMTEKEDPEAAMTNFKRAVQIDPNFFEAHFNLGATFMDQNDPEAAITSFEFALNVEPTYEYARAAKMCEQGKMCDWDALELDRKYVPKLGTTTQRIQPFSFLVFDDSPKNNQTRAELKASIDFKRKPILHSPPPIKKPKRLRIGYFSADFHNHATMFLMAKVFEAHDPENFEIYAYSFGPDKNDEMRQRLINAVDVFRDVIGINDRTIAVIAQQDKIDIAIDLKGHTKDAKTGIFAYRAAPLQINYLGYPGTMGCDFIDYIIADKITIPDQYEPYYNESIIRLPHSYQATDDTRVISDCHVTRSQFGLPEHGFVFCCFNNNYKITPTEFDIWMRILKTVNGSVIWLFKSNKWAQENLQLEAEKRGVSRDRLVFAEVLPQAEHLARQRLADLFIDTFNYNAHTTASDALWAGLPVVTKLGKGFSARVGGSILTAVGLPELITQTEQEYEALIIELATNPHRLAAIKQKLEQNRLTTPFFNTELFTKHLEDGYQQAYQLYFDNKKPKAIYVSG